MPNPIKTDDIYSGSLQSLLDELDAANDKWTALLKNVKDGAKTLEAQIKKLNAVQASGREEIDDTAKQATELEKAYKKYEAGLTDTAKEIAKVKAAQRELNTITKLETKLANSKAGSYNKLSAQYSLAKIKLNKMSIEEREATEAGRELVETSNDLFQEMKRLQAQTGKNTLNVGNYKSALEGIQTPFDGVINQAKAFKGNLVQMRSNLIGSVSGLSKGAKALKIFKIALISTGLGAILVLLGSFVAFLTKSQKGVDLAADAMTAFGAVLDIVFDRAAKLGSAIFKLFTGDFKGAIDDAKASVTGLGDEIRNEVGAMVTLGRTIRTLGRQIKVLDVVTAQTRATIKALNKDSEDTSLAFDRRAEAAKKAFKLESDLNKRREFLLGQEIAAMKERNAASNDLDADLEEIQAKEIELSNVRLQSLELQTVINNKLNTINKEQAARAKAAAEKRKREDAEEAKRIEKRIQRVEALKKAEEDGFAAASGAASMARLEYDRTLKKIEEMTAEAERLGVAFDPSGATEAALKKFRKAVQENLFDDLELVDNLPDRYEGAYTGLILSTKETRQAIEDMIEEQEPKDIFEMLGFDLGGDQGEGIKATFGVALGHFSDFLASGTEMANQAKAAADDRVKAAQEEVERQKELNAQGFQSNVARAEAELKLAEQSQEKAQKQQEKAQKAQRNLQTAEQAGNLLVASTKIWAQLGLPFLAIPAIALMWGSFIAAKVRASKLAKATFGKGKFFTIGGGTHASGNDTALNIEYDGKPAFAEKNEGVGVFTAKAMSTHGDAISDFVNGMNAGRFDERSVGVSQRASAGDSVTDTSVMERYLKNIEQQGQRKFRTDSSGKTYEYYQNRITIHQ